jgi:hypothetical protein
MTGLEVRSRGSVGSSWWAVWTNANPRTKGKGNHAPESPRILLVCLGAKSLAAGVLSLGIGLLMA